MGRACLENPAQAQLCWTSRLWGLASAWSQEQGEPARLWDQVRAMRAGGEKAEGGCWWWKIPGPEVPRTAWSGWAGSQGDGLMSRAH